jgi:hypothetical protein
LRGEVGGGLAVGVRREIEITEEMMRKRGYGGGGW